MRFIYFVILLFKLSLIQAQFSDLVFFNRYGNSFYVFLNGVIQNETPAPLVKITNVTAPSCRLAIEFYNPNLKGFKRDLFFTQGMETNYETYKNKKGIYTLKFVSEVTKIKDTLNIPYRQVVNYTRKSKKKYHTLEPDRLLNQPVKKGEDKTNSPLEKTMAVSTRQKCEIPCITE